MPHPFHSGPCFLDLPGELIDRTLCHLDLRTLLSCKQVCKRMKQRIEERKELQYIMELEVAGLQRNEHNGWPVAECLRSLQDYVSSWNKIEWSERSTIRMLEGRGWELYGGVFAQSDTAGIFHFMTLPSASRRIQQRDWTVRPDLDQPIAEFSMDPSQDLAVWVTTPTIGNESLDIHLRTLNTGNVHPLAQHSIIQHAHHPTRGKWSFVIRIMQEYLGLQAEYIPSTMEPDDITPVVKLFIWNWKEGSIELALETNDTQRFVFLSERHVVLANLYMSDDLAVTKPYLEIIDFKAEENTMKTLDQVQHSLTLSYPDIDGDAVVTVFSISSDPSPGWAPSEGDQVPFFPAKNNRLFVVPMRFTSHQESSFIHFIPLSTLEKCLDCINLSAGGTRNLGWSDWAPETTRLIETRLQTSALWIYFTHGSRCTGRLLVHERDTGLEFAVVLYDLNQLAIRRENARGGISSPDSFTYLDEPTRSGSEWPFNETIETSLPISIRIKRLPVEPGPGTHCHMMCSADNMVLVNTETREYRIFTF